MSLTEELKEHSRNYLRRRQQRSDTVAGAAENNAEYTAMGWQKVLNGS